MKHLTTRSKRIGALLALSFFLAGNAQAGKRMLVRLRHSAKVKVASGGDTPQYSWFAD